jgi:hypothetical protein
MPKHRLKKGKELPFNDFYIEVKEVDYHPELRRVNFCVMPKFGLEDMIAKNITFIMNKYEFDEWFEEVKEDPPIDEEIRAEAGELLKKGFNVEEMKFIKTSQHIIGIYGNDIGVRKELKVYNHKGEQVFWNRVKEEWEKVPSEVKGGNLWSEQENKLLKFMTESEREEEIKRLKKVISYLSESAGLNMKSGEVKPAEIRISFDSGNKIQFIEDLTNEKYYPFENHYKGGKVKTYREVTE